MSLSDFSACNIWRVYYCCRRYWGVYHWIAPGHLFNCLIAVVADWDVRHLSKCSGGRLVVIIIGIVALAVGVIWNIGPLARHRDGGSGVGDDAGALWDHRYLGIIGSICGPGITTPTPGATIPGIGAIRPICIQYGRVWKKRERKKEKTDS